jgi:hypothetical protein
MSDDLITAESVTKELLCELFDAAYMDVKVDDDGAIIVQERCSVYVFPDSAKKRIRLLTQFGFVPTATPLQKLEAANKINVEYLFIRASVIKDSLRFDYDISLDHGISKKGLVLILKRFAQIPHAAVQDHALDIVS